MLYNPETGKYDRAAIMKAAWRMAKAESGKRKVSPRTLSFAMRTMWGNARYHKEQSMRPAAEALAEKIERARIDIVALEGKPFHQTAYSRHYQNDLAAARARLRALEAEAA